MTEPATPVAAEDSKPQGPKMETPKPESQKAKVKPKKPAKRRPTARQRNLMKLLLEVELGKLTITQALMKAGYAKSTAEQQSETLRNIRENSVMQAALRKVGFTEDTIAKKIMDGLEAERTFVIHEGEDTRLETAPDLDVQHKFLKTGAELLDAFPAQKSIQAQVGIEALLDDTEKTVEYPERFPVESSGVPAELPRLAAKPSVQVQTEGGGTENVSPQPLSGGAVQPAVPEVPRPAGTPGN